MYNASFYGSNEVLVLPLYYAEMFYYEAFDC